jgi:hypothetical protein
MWLTPSTMSRSGTALSLLPQATETLPDAETARLYAQFLDAREAAMIEEIRRACGITQTATAADEDALPDEVAADVKAGAGAFDADEELEGLDGQSVSALFGTE